MLNPLGSVRFLSEMNSVRKTASDFWILLPVVEKRFVKLHPERLKSQINTLLINSLKWIFTQGYLHMFRVELYAHTWADFLYFMQMTRM